MQITIDVPDEMTAEANAVGLPLDRYILERLVGTGRTGEHRQRTVAEAIEAIRELRKGNRLNGLRIKDLIEEGRRY